VHACNGFVIPVIIIYLPTYAVHRGHNSDGCKELCSRCADPTVITITVRCLHTFGQYARTLNRFAGNGHPKHIRHIMYIIWILWTRTAAVAIIIPIIRAVRPIRKLLFTSARATRIWCVALRIKRCRRVRRINVITTIIIWWRRRRWWWWWRWRRRR